MSNVLEKMKQKRGYWSPGLILNDEVPETDMTPVVKYQWKPLPRGEKQRFIERAMKIFGDNAFAEACKLKDEVVKRVLVSWDLTDPETGNVVDFKNPQQWDAVDDFIIDAISDAALRQARRPTDSQIVDLERELERLKAERDREKNS